MVQERKDRLMAYRVEMGLKVQQTVSTKAAAAYMASFGVPMHVSIRVLSSDKKRGPGDGKEPPLWFDVIRSAGPTYGSRTDFT